MSNHCLTYPTVAGRFLKQWFDTDHGLQLYVGKVLPFSRDEYKCTANEYHVGWRSVAWANNELSFSPLFDETFLAVPVCTYSLLNLLLSSCACITYAGLVPRLA